MKPKQFYNLFRQSWKSKLFRLTSYLCLSIICLSLSVSIYSIYVKSKKSLIYHDEVIYNRESSKIKKRREKINAAMGWGFNFSQSWIQEATKAGDVIFRAKITIDEFGRRIVPNNTLNLNQRKKHLIITGGSYVLSQNVDDQDTFTNLIAEVLDDHHIYVYGGWWYSPAHFLRRFEVAPITQEIKQDSGLTLVVFNKAHLLGILGDSCYLVHENNFHSPSFEMKSNKLVYAGKWSEIFEKRYRVMRNLPNLLQNIYTEYCWNFLESKYHNLDEILGEYTREQMNLIFNVFKAYKNILEKQLPKTKVIFLNMNWGKKPPSKFINAAKEYQLQVKSIEMDNLNTDLNPDTWHLNSEGEKGLAKLILPVIYDSMDAE